MWSVIVFGCFTLQSCCLLFLYQNESLRNWLRWECQTFTVRKAQEFSLISALVAACGAENTVLSQENVILCFPETHSEEVNEFKLDFKQHFA